MQYMVSMLRIKIIQFVLGSHLTRATSRTMPESGAISAVIWLIVIDEILQTLDRGHNDTGIPPPAAKSTKNDSLLEYNISGCNHLKINWGMNIKLRVKKACSGFYVFKRTFVRKWDFRPRVVL